ncbi:NPP1 family protein [Rheinheimera sp.]|uniref:NPP1 family protein n=1 Tax=Rheinheimera sp. TaxID=1869214 RepID=UPI003AF912F2
MKLLTSLIVTATAAVSLQAIADDFPALDQALPGAVDAYSIAPVFDFDTDGCLPSAGISRSGQMNGGLKPSGSLGGSCRSSNFLQSSNTLHRFQCQTVNAVTYCGHLYALYFEKDQLFANIESGHRHDWEFAAVFTQNGVVTHGSYSTHGDVVTTAAAMLPFDNGHLKLVYHKDGVSTHVLRFAGADEAAENPYGYFVTPAIASWFELYGDGLSNSQMRSLLNGFNYGSANLPVSDANFINNLNEAKPDSYPTF